jgi:hypothetical protein
VQEIGERSQESAGAPFGRCHQSLLQGYVGDRLGSLRLSGACEQVRPEVVKIRYRIEAVELRRRPVTLMISEGVAETRQKGPVHALPFACSTAK